MTCSIRFIQPFARYLRATGHDVEAWLGPHGLSAAHLVERELRISQGEASALVREAVALTGDAALGMRAARCVGPGDFDVVEYAAASCATAGEAMRLAARFIALMHEGISMQLDVEPPLAALRVRVLHGAEQVPASIELVFASLLEYGSRSLGHRTRPLRVELAHAGPADAGIYQEIFREVRFGAPEHVMWVKAAALDLPHCAPDRSLVQILTSHADGLLQQLERRPRRFAERARAAIIRDLSAGSVAAEHIARRLAVSLRTFYRRLAEEGTTHGELVDDVRRTEAMQHLAAGSFSIAEISFLLGFAHPNAFHKAFKRWTGRTPAHFRGDALARWAVSR
ncbi:MAG TPA: AraC family transcriptional regulator [Kofleriaceae bacterium]|nr:AraC family transcriptional regulator [Kofleriaceae bacterium]